MELVQSHRLVKEERGWVCRGARPSEAWHRHGYTRKTIGVLAATRVMWVVVHKQRWRHTVTGETRHDRPPSDVPWSYFGLGLVLCAAWAWMSSPRGLHHVAWPWEDEAPSRRTVQRWVARLLADALPWQAAIRSAVTAHLAPSTLEEKFPTGLPPPGGVTRWRSAVLKAKALTHGLALLQKSASLLSIPMSTLLVEAQRRFMDDRQP